MKYSIFFPIVIVGIISSSDCKKSGDRNRKEKKDSTESSSRYVSSESGLFLREEPSVKAKSIVLIPQGAKVKVLKEESETVTISGATGKWTQVKFRDEEGWAFGGFLVKKLIDKNQMKTIEHLETLTAKLKSETDKKKFQDALNAYKEAFYSSDKSKLEKLELAYSKAKILAQDSESKLSNSTRSERDAYYAFGDLGFETCMSFQKAKNCTEQNLKPKQFSSPEEALKLLKKSIETKDAKLLASATGCMLNVGCFFCDSGPTYAVAEPAIAEMFSKNRFSGKIEFNREYESDDYKTVDFGDMNEAFGIVMTKETNGKWEMDHIRNGAKPVCSGTESGW